MASPRLLSTVSRLPWDHVGHLPEKFEHILKIFPDNLRFAFAYGSGAFRQHGNKSTEVIKSLAS